jgi:hypothetical protein
VSTNPKRDRCQYRYAQVDTGNRTPSEPQQSNRYDHPTSASPEQTCFGWRRRASIASFDLSKLQRPANDGGEENSSDWRQEKEVGDNFRIAPLAVNDRKRNEKDEYLKFISEIQQNGVMNPCWRPRYLPPNRTRRSIGQTEQRLVQ